MQFNISIILLLIFYCACSKNVEETINNDTLPPTQLIAIEKVPDNAILIDATKDGGVWWFPQSGSFSATLPHQGKNLADFLSSLGFTVNELPRGTTITWDELKKYKKVIRVGGFGNYTLKEIEAYDSLLYYSSSLLLLTDHLQNFPNDQLSAHLGLNFQGSYTGNIYPSSNHFINTGVNSLPYIAGSLIMEPDFDKMTILGYVGSSSSETGYAAMGILHHPNSKIFFMGDANCIQQIPQPFTSNLVNWLFK